MTLLPHLAARLFGVPLAIHRPKLDLILAVLGPRVGVAELAAPAGFTAPPRSTATPTSGVAVIPIHGTLVRRTVGLEAESGLTSYTQLAAQLDAALANPEVAAILLDIDSPGGESGGVFDLADRIRAATQVKPVWAVANDMAFSAAYALASAASKVFVSRTGGVGSIGVIAMHVDQSEKDAQDGVRYTAVFAGERKNDLNPHAPITSEAHAFLQAEVDRIYGLFVDTVARNRGLDAAAVQGTEAGLYFGQAALAIGLADAIGTVEDALEALRATVLPTLNPLAPMARDPSGPTSHLHQEISMQDIETSHAQEPAPTPVPAPNPAPSPAPIEPIASPARSTLTVSDAVEIAQTCTLAGRTDLIAGFLEAQASPAQVRSQLLATQADASPEIVSRIDPQAAMAAAHAGHPASPHNPLVQAVKGRLAQH